MTGTIYIAEKAVNLTADIFDHVYLVYDPDGVITGPGATSDEKVIRGGLTTSLSATDLTLQVDLSLSASDDHFTTLDPDPASRGFVALDTGTASALDVWNSMVAIAEGLGTAISGTGYSPGEGIDTGLTYNVDFNSNSTIASILSELGIQISDIMPLNPSTSSHLSESFFPEITHLYGGDGIDNFVIDETVTYIDGRGGTNSVDFSHIVHPLNIDLKAGVYSGTLVSGEIHNIQVVTGTDYDDTIRGNSDSNIIHGGDGNDTLIYNYSDQYSTLHTAQYYGDGGTSNQLQLELTTGQLTNAVRDEILQFNHDIINDTTPLDGIDHTFTNLNLDVHSIESVAVQQDGHAVSLATQAYDDDFRIDAGTTGFTGNVLADNGHGVDYTFGSALTPTTGTFATDQGGSITISSDGSFTYTPINTSYLGADTYTYTVTDTAGDTSTAVLHLNVNEVQSGDGNISFSVGHGGNAYGGDGENTIVGTIYSDYLSGGGGDDSIYGGDGGNDVLDGGAGDDYLLASNGNSVLYGGDGNDTLRAGGYSYFYGGDGNDSIYGVGYIDAGAGNDTVYPGIGNSVINLGSGDDMLYDIYSGNNIIHGGGGSDILHVADGNNTIYADGGAIDVWTGDGDNTIFGGNSSDQIQLGNGSNNFTGGTGNDVVTVGTGANTLLGGGGDDRFVLGEGHSYIDGGSGNNEIDLLGNTSTETGVNFNINDSANNMVDGWGNTQTVIHVETVLGTWYNDTFTAADRAVSINAGEGDDTITFTSSASVTDESTLIGGLGTDTLNLYVTSAELNDATREQIAHYAQDQAGAGSSPYNSEAIFDLSGLHLSLDMFDNFNLYVDGVATTINVTAHDDAFEGLINTTQTGNVLVDNGHGADTGFAHDLSIATDHITSVNGSTLDLYSDGSFSYSPAHDFSGTDNFDYTLQDSWGHTDTGHITIAVGSIVGTEGADFISTTSVDDFVYAGGGDDTIYASTGNDTIDGGDGHNIVDYSGLFTNPYSILEVDLSGSTMTANKGFYGHDTLTNIDGIIAGSGSDYLVGNAHDNYFDGGGGGDTILGNDGNDTIYGGDGDDYIDGGTGDNYLDGGTGDNTIVAADGNNTIYALDGNNTVTLGDGHNIIHLGDGANTITVGAGNNEIHAGAGGNTITTGDGDNTIYTTDGNDYITIGAGNNIVHSGAGDDIVYGGHGTVYGGAGDDDIELGDGGNIIHGGSGDDYISSGAGDDILDGGSGSNYIVGGAGADTFVFTPYSIDGNLTTIADFNPSGDNDVINLKDLLTGYSPGTSNIDDFVHLTQSGANMVLSVDTDGPGTTNTFQNVATLQSVSGLTVDDLFSHSHLTVTA